MLPQVYLMVKDLRTHDPMGPAMGPMSERKAKRVTAGLLINMSEDCYVDEWPAADGEFGGNQQAFPTPAQGDE